MRKFGIAIHGGLKEPENKKHEEEIFKGLDEYSNPPGKIKKEIFIINLIVNQCKGIKTNNFTIISAY